MSAGWHPIYQSRCLSRRPKVCTDSARAQLSPPPARARTTMPPARPPSPHLVVMRSPQIHPQWSSSSSPLRLQPLPPLGSTFPEFIGILHSGFPRSGGRAPSPFGHASPMASVCGQQFEIGRPGVVAPSPPVISASGRVRGSDRGSISHGQQRPFRSGFVSEGILFSSHFNTGGRHHFQAPA